MTFRRLIFKPSYHLSTAARTYSYQRTTSWILDASESSVGHNFTVVLQRGTTGTPWPATLINQA